MDNIMYLYLIHSIYTYVYHTVYIHMLDIEYDDSIVV